MAAVWRRMLICLWLAACGGSAASNAGACRPIAAVDGLTDTRQYDVFTLDEDGGLQPLTDDRLSFGPALSPDGEWVVFTRAAEGSHEECCGYGETALRLADIEGEVIAGIPIAEGWNDSSAAVSADGSRVSFMRRDRGGTATRLMVVDVEVDAMPTTAPTVLADLGDRSWIGRPAWSPDGRTIAVTVSGDSEYPVAALLLVDAETGAVEETGIEVAGNPAWSPDGERIALSSNGYEGTPVREVDLASGAAVDVPQPEQASWTNAGYVVGGAGDLRVLRFEQTVDQPGPQRVEVVDLDGQVRSSAALEQRRMIAGEGQVLVGSLSVSRCFGGER